MTLTGGPNIPKPALPAAEAPVTVLMPEEIRNAYSLFSDVRKDLFPSVDEMIIFFIRLDLISKGAIKISEKEVARSAEVEDIKMKTSDYLLGLAITSGFPALFLGGLAGAIAKYLDSRHGLAVGSITGVSVAAFLALIYHAVASKSLYPHLDPDAFSGTEEKRGEMVIADILSRWAEVSRILNKNNIEPSRLSQAVLGYAEKSGNQYRLGFPFETQD